MSVENLEVTATLSGPIILYQALHLDALLMGAVAMREGIPAPAHHGELVEIAIPVERSACGRYYLASASACEAEAYELKYVNRRFPLEQLEHMGDGSTTRVNLAAGKQKHYRVPVESKHLRADKITWWCRGEREEIQQLLSLVSHVGRRRAVGLGRVAQWSVDPCEAWAGFPVLRDGAALRNLPLDVEGLTDFALGVERVSPPYWLYHDRAECAVPASSP